MTSIRFRRELEGATLPIKGTSLSAAFDLYAAVSCVIPAGSRGLVDTGLSLSGCPDDVYLRIAPRSGLAVKGYDIGAGVVDSDYRGSVKILFINTTSSDYEVQSGARIAQMIPERIRVDLTCVIDGEENTTTQQYIRTERGKGGFGSTQ